MSLLYEQTICNTIPPPLFFIQSVYRAPIFPLLSLLLINERPFNEYPAVSSHKTVFCERNGSIPFSINDKYDEGN